jgi:hypothetical protein
MNKFFLFLSEMSKRKIPIEYDVFRREGLKLLKADIVSSEKELEILGIEIEGRGDGMSEIMKEAEYKCKSLKHDIDELDNKYKRTKTRIELYKKLVLQVVLDE